jgi:predicted Fe-Mo cluster-binding NifX family protein
MKIAISAKEPDLAGPIGKSPAQSGYWIIFDTANQSFTVLDKKHIEFGDEQFWWGFLGQNNIAMVVAEDFPPAVMERLKFTHIRVMRSSSPSIQEALASIYFRDIEAAQGGILQGKLV